MTNYSTMFNNLKVDKKNRAPMSKKTRLLLVIFLIVIVVGILFFNNLKIVEVESQDSIVDSLNQNISEQLKDLDLGNLDDALSELQDYKIFENSSFSEKVTSLINGKYFDDYNGLISVMLSVIIGNFSKILPFILLIIAIAVITQILDSFKSERVSDGVRDIIHFVSFSLVVLLIVAQFRDIFATTNATLSSVKNQMDAIFPVLLTILVAVGGVVSVSIFKPMVAILTQGVTVLFNGFIFPLFVLSFLFVVVGNLTNTVKLNKFQDLIGSVFKWSVGIIFTIFSGILSIQGISAGKYDKVSVVATKFTLKSYVPIIGGYLSEGLDFILLSSILIKNAVGVVGLFLLLITVLSPILQILIFKLSLQLVGAVLEPIGESKIGKFATDCSKILIYPIVIILAVSFMYILSVGLIICTANVI